LSESADLKLGGLSSTDQVSGVRGGRKKGKERGKDKESSISFVSLYSFVGDRYGFFCLARFLKKKKGGGKGGRKGVGKL